MPSDTDTRTLQQLGFDFCEPEKRIRGQSQAIARPGDTRTPTPTRTRTRTQAESPARPLTAREKRNNEAIALMQVFNNSGRTPTPGSKGRKILQGYTGYGGILSSQESKGQYFTPYWICEILTRMIGVEPGARVFDPTCGTGRFAEFLPFGADFTGIEIEPQAANIAKLLYPNHNIEHGDILCNLQFRNQFDYILGNPPFGLWWEVNPKKSNVASAAGKVLSQWKILESSIQAVKEGGVLGLVVPKNTFTNDRAGDVRAIKFWNSNCIVRAEIELPGKAFGPSGTEWPCSVLIVQRPPAKSLSSPFQYVMKDKPEASDIMNMFKYFVESNPHQEMKESFGTLMKDRRADKRTYQVNTEFIEKKKKFDHEYTGKILTKTDEDIVYVRRSGHKLLLKPNGIIAALKLEAWKKSFERGTNWRRYLTVNEIVLRDNIRGFQNMGLKMEIDPAFSEFMRGKRKFYKKESIDIKDVTTARPVEFKKNMKKLKSLGLWDKLFPYQRLDACIHADKNFSFLGYKQRLGKTRTAIAAVMLKGTKRNLFVCYARLVDVFEEEMTNTDPKKGLGIDPEEVKIIREVHDLNDLRKYNIISFETLRKQKKKDPSVECPKCGTMVNGKICKGPNMDMQSDNKTCGWHRFNDAVCPECSGKTGKEYPKAQGITLRDDDYTGRYCKRCGYATTTWIEGIYKRMRKLFSCIVVDESQAAKNKNSLQGQALRSLKAKHKIILTGTILENYVSEAYWQLWWLLGASCRFPYPFHGGHAMFTKQFCKFGFTKSGRKRMEPSLINAPQFHKIFDSIMTRRTEKDKLVKESITLPELPENPPRITLEPTPEEVSLYNQVMDDFEEWYEEQLFAWGRCLPWERSEMSQKLSAAVLVKLNMLRQVSSCPFKFDGYEGGSTSKMKFIKGIVAERVKQGKKVLISSSFKGLVYRMADELPAAEAFTGDISIPKRNVIKKRFQEDDDIKVLCLTTQVANLGLDLSAASTIVIADLLWSPKQMEQMMLRVWGPKQKEKVIEILFLINKGMIDEDMDALTTAKDNAINEAIDRKVSTGGGKVWSPMEFANKMLAGRGSSWIKKYF